MSLPVSLYHSAPPPPVPRRRTTRRLKTVTYRLTIKIYAATQPSIDGVIRSVEQALTRVSTEAVVGDTTHDSEMIRLISDIQVIDSLVETGLFFCFIRIVS